VRSGRLVVENYRGRHVPRTLGIWLALAAWASVALIALTGWPAPVARAGWGAFVATLLVFAAGLVDDLVPAGPRGLRNHLRGLAAGRVSTGIVKVIVIVATALVAIALQSGRSGWIRLAGVVLVAASANVWNGLDVRPGRAIKFGLLAFLGLAPVDLALLPSLPGVALGSAAALWFDLNERAMLGDGGANFLGFTIGLGLYLVLPGWGVILAAAVAVAVNGVAETFTLSRVIDAVPPLRWFDALGRKNDAET
jgi:UDP-N-acetylmuramyl pentapeptide phosphotransferase/UDP-N-acetylglucosamine-1-phosphate transferase